MQIKNELIKEYLRQDHELNGSGEVERLAVKAKISPTRLRLLINGNVKHVLRVDKAIRLAIALGTSIETLFLVEAA
jgi:plasmid maintenance system antidote protein VapI